MITRLSECRERESKNPKDKLSQEFFIEFALPSSPHYMIFLSSQSWALPTRIVELHDECGLGWQSFMDPK